MMSKHKTEVLVAGAGPVGMFTALSLGIAGSGWRSSTARSGPRQLLRQIGLEIEL